MGFLRLGKWEWGEGVVVDSTRLSLSLSATKKRRRKNQGGRRKRAGCFFFFLKNSLSLSPFLEAQGANRKTSVFLSQHPRPRSKYIKSLALKISKKKLVREKRNKKNGRVSRIDIFTEKVFFLKKKVGSGVLGGKECVVVVELLMEKQKTES